MEDVYLPITRVKRKGEIKYSVLYNNAQIILPLDIDVYVKNKEQYVKDDTLIKSDIYSKKKRDTGYFVILNELIVHKLLSSNGIPLDIERYVKSFLKKSDSVNSTSLSITSLESISGGKKTKKYRKRRIRKSMKKY